jgi:hypothetical protein
MIAVCTPDDDARIVAQDGQTTYSFGQATKYWANLDFIVHQPGVQEARFSLRLRDIATFISLVKDSLNSPDRFIGRLSNDFAFSYDALRVGIKQGSQNIEMPQWIAKRLVEALRE